MWQVFKIAFPVGITFFGFMFMQLVDLMFVGHLGPAAIGAVGISTSFFSWFTVIGAGISFALDFLTSYQIGAKRPEEAQKIYFQSLWVSVFIFIPAYGIFWAITQNLQWFGTNPEVIPGCEVYSQILGTTLLSNFLFSMSRSYLQAQKKVAPAFFLLIYGNIVNAFFNYLLVSGRWGFPALGLEGSAWATFIARFSMAAIMLAYVSILIKKLPLAAPDFGRVIKIIKVGLPASGQLLFEVGAFATATALAGRLSSVELATHQIVLTSAGLCFMLPLGMSSAASSLVGNALGANDLGRAKKQGWQVLYLGFWYSLFTSAMFIFAPSWVTSFYTESPEVHQLAYQLFGIVAIFQMFDCAQAILTGDLRGLGDTKSPIWMNFVGHWMVGLPVGIYLCFATPLGLKGLWIGLALGLIVVSVLLLMGWRRRLVSLEKAQEV